MKQVLIIDDQADVRMAATIALSHQGFQCLEADSPNQALAILSTKNIDLILLDMNFTLDTTSGQEGLAFLQQKQQQGSHIPTVVMTAWASVDIAVEAMKLGAVDFIEKPWKNARLVSIVQHQLQYANVIKENARLTALTQTKSKTFLAQSQVMIELLAKAKRAALSDANILITGENGTGKSLLADYIHAHSARATQRMVSVNMGAIPENLFESELFGHKKGAFTDAKEDRLGRFDLATNGTLFLDEVGTLPAALQAKMLRVLETGEYEMVGSSQTQQTNARILSATNANLEKLIEQDLFRRDLLFRLNTIELHLPPLRERIEDIALLATELVGSHGKKYQRPQLTLSPEALALLTQQPWKGNVRELSHCIERAVIMSDSDILGLDSLAINSPRAPANQTNASQTAADPKTAAQLANGGGGPLLTLEQAEKHAIESALKHFDGNVVEAGQFLEISKSAIYRRIEKFEIDLKR